MNEVLNIASAIRVTLEPGDIVLWSGRHHEIVRIISLQHLLLRDPFTGGEHQVNVGDVLPVLAPELNPAPKPSYTTKAYLEQAAARERALRPYVLGHQRLTSPAMEVLSKTLSLKSRQIYSLVKRLRANPTPAAIASRLRGPRKGRHLLDPAVELIVQKELKLRVRSKQSSGLKPIREAIELTCHQAGLKTPSRETIRQRIELRARELALRQKYGVKRARERTSAKAGVIRTTAALALVECDHTPLDIFIVDSTSRQNIGRAFLTIVIDCHTRAILGFHISLDNPCATSVALAIHHAILPKERWLAERGLGYLSWPMYGVFEALQVDGGAELNGQAAMAGCLKWGIELVPRGDKENGGIIERSIGKIQFAAADEPGATGNRPRERREYDPSRDAQMTLQEAEVWVAEQIISFYHTAWHDRLQMSAAKAWELAHTTEDGLVLPAVVTDERELLLSFLPFEARVISPNGIHLFGSRYWTSALSTYVGSEHKFRVKYDARNNSRVYVEVDDGIYIDVPFADPSQEALPLFEDRYRRRQARRDHNEEFDHDARFAAMARRDERRRRSKRSLQEARRKEKIRQSLAATAAFHQDPQQLAPPSPETGSHSRADYRRAPVVNWDEGDV